MKIGILKETKIPVDNRVPLTPEQCRDIEKIFPALQVVVQPSADRCYTDEEYSRAGITLDDDLGSCDLLMGVKEVKAGTLLPGKTYMFFSHTIKKQPQNRELLKTILARQIRLIDYELLTGQNGSRIIGFGRWAGLVGAYNGIRAVCRRHELPEPLVPQLCGNLRMLMREISGIKLPPLKFVLTGGGRVACGAQELLNAAGIRQVSIDDYLNITGTNHPVYVQLDPDGYSIARDGRPFDLNHFFRHPEAYASNFGRFYSTSDVLISAAYWDPSAPVLFTKEEMRTDDFRIRIIADITCDINGSVASTIRTTTLGDPFYDYNRLTGREEPPFSNPENITMMAIDNLPCGLPREASGDFGRNLTNAVLPSLIENDDQGIVARAVIADAGRLTDKYRFLEDWLKD
jgi:alanine dehydrogenase